MKKGGDGKDTVLVKFTADEYAEVRMHARQAGMSINSYMEACVRKIYDRDMKRSSKLVKLNFTLPAHERDDLQAYAKAHGKTVSATIRDALLTFFAMPERDRARIRQAPQPKRGRPAKASFRKPKARKAVQ